MPTKILAIDDSKTMRLAIKITFAAEDAEVVAVSKGSEAVARAKQMPADIVLVDHRLSAGEPSGFDVVRALKADPATASLPVLMLVPSTGGVSDAQVSECGADGSIKKPFDTGELIKSVNERVGQPSAARPAAPTPAATIVMAMPMAVPAAVTIAIATSVAVGVTVVDDVLVISHRPLHVPLTSQPPHTKHNRTDVCMTGHFIGGTSLVALHWWHFVGGTLLVAHRWWHVVYDRTS